jgi:hypothetical protein
LHSFYINPAFEPLLQELGLTELERFFGDKRIQPWRIIPERENCVLDVNVAGLKRRFHVKRFNPTAGRVTPAEQEARGIHLLDREGIPTVPLVAWGVRRDGRSCIMVDDLQGCEPADRTISAHGCFDELAPHIARLAARLHRKLHHRDLYLCHFFVRRSPLDVRIIDAGRVRELPIWPLRQRWIIKDLAQLWYSTLPLDVTDAQREAMLAEYAAERGVKSVKRLRRSIESKVARIAKHDRRLKERSPGRNVSIPS